MLKRSNEENVNPAGSHGNDGKDMKVMLDVQHPNDVALSIPRKLIADQMPSTNMNIVDPED
jgi:hypothetical protein